MALDHAPRTRHPARTHVEESFSPCGEVRNIVMLLLLTLATALEEAHGFSPCTCEQDHVSCWKSDMEPAMQTAVTATSACR